MFGGFNLDVYGVSKNYLMQIIGYMYKNNWDALAGVGE